MLKSQTRPKWHVNALKWLLKLTAVILTIGGVGLLLSLYALADWPLSIFPLIGFWLLQVSIWGGVAITILAVCLMTYVVMRSIIE